MIVNDNEGAESKHTIFTQEKIGSNWPVPTEELPIQLPGGQWLPSRSSATNTTAPPIRSPAFNLFLDDMNYSLPISPAYRKAIFEALILQIIIGVLSAMILDGGDCALICGVAFLAFWGGAAVLILRCPQSPTQTDILLIRFGYFLVIFIAGGLVHFIWHLRGFE